MSSRRRAPGGRTSPICVVEAVRQVRGSVTALPSSGFRRGEESSPSFNTCLGQQVLVLPKFSCSHWLNCLLMYWQDQSKARTSPGLSEMGLGAAGVSSLQRFRHLISIPSLRCQMSWPHFVATNSHFQTDFGDRETEKRCLVWAELSMGCHVGARVRSSSCRCQTVCIMHNVRTRDQRGVEIRQVDIMSYTYKAFCHKVVLSPYLKVFKTKLEKTLGNLVWSHS